MTHTIRHPTFAAVLVLFGGACRDTSHARPAVTIAHATFAITNVRVFDGDHVLPRTNVVVDGDKIVAIGPQLAVPAGVTLVDGAGKTLLPGLIDAHVHVWDRSQLEQALAFGVTTELDMFTSPDLVKEIRTENRADLADLRSAGTLATAPGGHGTEYGLPIPTIDAPDQAQAFVDARFAEGSDYLKIIFDSGEAYGIKLPTISEPTLRALVEAAHKRGKLAVAHIGSYREARAAIDAGVDGLMHLFVDAAPAPDFAALVAAKHAFVTPTLTVLHAERGDATTIGADPAIAPYLGSLARTQLAATFGVRAKLTPGAVEAAVAQLRDAHVPILAGTDSPNPGTTHGASLHDELALLVAAGLSPVAALAAATSVPAGRFSLPDRGAIAVGLRADLVLVTGDPTTTITDTRNIVGIWRAGVKLDRAAYQARMAEDLKVAAAPVDLGPISDFDDGTTRTRFGQAWVVSTDSVMGGKSTATLSVIDGSGRTPSRALAIEGEVVAGAPASWAGALFSPGAQDFAVIDVSGKRGVSFVASGDGKPAAVMVFTKAGGFEPSTRPFTPGKQPARVQFAWHDFDGSDGKDVTAIMIGRTEPGKFRIVIDDVALE